MDIPEHAPPRQHKTGRDGPDLFEDLMGKQRRDASLTHHWPMPLSWMPIILPTWGLPLFQKLSNLLGRPIRVCFDYAYSGAVGLINKGV
jgi:hypothetical protein